MSLIQLFASTLSFLSFAQFQSYEKAQSDFAGYFEKNRVQANGSEIDAATDWYCTQQWSNFSGFQKRDILNGIYETMLGLSIEEFSQKNPRSKKLIVTRSANGFRQKAKFKDGEWKMPATDKVARLVLNGSAFVVRRKTPGAPQYEMCLTSNQLKALASRIGISGPTFDQAKAIAGEWTVAHLKYSNYESSRFRHGNRPTNVQPTEEGVRLFNESWKLREKFYQLIPSKN